MSVSFRSTAFEIKKSIDYYEFKGAEIEYILDQERNYTIETLPQNQFVKTPKNSPNFGLYDGVVWLRVKMPSRTARKVTLEIKNPLLDSISVYERAMGGFELIYQLGDRYKFSQRPIEHRFFQMQIHVPNEFIIRINNFGDSCQIPITIATYKGITDRDLYGQFLWGTFFGLIIVFLSINLKLYLFGKVQNSIYYIGYLVFISLVQFSFSGIGFQYIYSNSPEFANRILPFSGVLSAFFIILFTQKFLNIKRYNPKLNIAFWIFEALSLLIAAMQFIPTLSAYKYGILFTNLFILLGSGLVFMAAVQALKRKFKPAIYYFIGLITNILGAVVFIIRNFGVVPDNIYTEYSLQIGTASFAGFLTLAILQGYKDNKMEAITNLKKMDALRKNEGEKMDEEIEEQTKEIESKKQEIALKNAEMINSINFAKKIQTHLLPKQSTFESQFESCFLTFMPKDIVSGDFYWQQNLQTDSSDRSFVFCIGDCTGHGVPGAMISVLALRFLSSAVSEVGLSMPAEILNYVNKEFTKSFLTEETSSNINDGMDCVICHYNPEAKILTYSGAKNGLILIRDGELTTYPGERRSIGGANIIEHIFKQTKIQLQKGDCVYLQTDGYSDQFGGPNFKKIKNNAVRNLLLENHQKPLKNQGEIITEFFNHWKGNQEQTDDVCVLGFRID